MSFFSVFFLSVICSALCMWLFVCIVHINLHVPVPVIILPVAWLSPGPWKTCEWATPVYSVWLPLPALQLQHPFLLYQTLTPLLSLLSPFFSPPLYFLYHPSFSVYFSTIPPPPIHFATIPLPLYFCPPSLPSPFSLLFPSPPLSPGPSLLPWVVEEVLKKSGPSWDMNPGPSETSQTLLPLSHWVSGGRVVQYYPTVWVQSPRSQQLSFITIFHNHQTHNPARSNLL